MNLRTFRGCAMVGLPGHVHTFMMRKGDQVLAFPERIPVKDTRRRIKYRRLLRRKMHHAHAADEETRGGGSLWPIYIIAAGVVTIITRYITDEQNQTIATIEWITGGSLIGYGVYRFFRDR